MSDAPNDTDGVGTKTTKSDAHAGELFKRVSRDLANDDWGAIKIATTEAMIGWLEDRDPDVVTYHLKRLRENPELPDFDAETLEDLKRQVRQRYADKPEFDLLAYDGPNDTDDGGD